MDWVVLVLALVLQGGLELLLSAGFLLSFSFRRGGVRWGAMRRGHEGYGLSLLSCLSCLSVVGPGRSNWVDPCKRVELGQ